MRGGRIGGGRGGCRGEGGEADGVGRREGGIEGKGEGGWRGREGRRGG